MNERLKTAMAHATTEPKPSEIKSSLELPETTEQSADYKDNRIVTTEEEIEGYHIVKAVLREVLDPNRIIMRDTASYCGILLDDNNRKPICRLHFNGTQKFVTIMGAEKVQERIAIEQLNDIFRHADELQEGGFSWSRSNLRQPKRGLAALRNLPQNVPTLRLQLNGFCIQLHQFNEPVGDLLHRFSQSLNIDHQIPGGNVSSIECPASFFKA